MSSQGDNRIFRAPAAPVTIEIEDAEDISLALADLLCWIAGFKAACPDNLERHPQGDHAARHLNEKIKDALNRAGRKAT